MNKDDAKGCLLSIVLCGRNDDYLGDFKHRIETSINYLCRNADRIGRLKNIEVIVADWNSEIPLSDVLPLIPQACKATKFIVVPPNIALNYNGDGYAFNGECALNSGIRRAEGKYVMIMPADTLITTVALNNLLLLLEGKLDATFDPEKTMLNLGRKLIPWQIVERQPSLDEWDRYLQLHNRHLRYDNDYPGLAHGLGAILLEKQIWEESHAFEETVFGWGWSDIEFGLRINRRYPSVDLSFFGIVLYDMSQKPEITVNVRRGAPHKLPTSFNTANANWGLKKYNLSVNRCALSEDNKGVRSAAIGTTLPKGKTYAAFVDNIGNLAIRQHMIKNLSNQDLNLAEWESLSALSWYALYYYPRSFLDLGAKKVAAAKIVSAACSTVEIYVTEPWENKGKYPAHIPYNAIDILYSVGYRGYLWFLSGDIHSTFQRMRDSSIGHISPDLVLFNGDMFPTHSNKLLGEIVPHLADGGMLVFTCSSAERFQDVWRRAKSIFLDFVFLQCTSGRTGLILSASLAPDLQNRSDVKHETYLDFGPQPSFLDDLQQSRIFRALRKPSKYHEYAKRILNFLCGR